MARSDDKFATTDGATTPPGRAHHPDLVVETDHKRRVLTTRS
jgi:hypothetical protein